MLLCPPFSPLFSFIIQIYVSVNALPDVTQMAVCFPLYGLLVPEVRAKENVFMSWQEKPHPAAGGRSLPPLSRVATPSTNGRL